MTALSRRVSCLNVMQISVLRTELCSFGFHPLLSCLNIMNARYSKKMVVQSWFSDDKNNNMGYSVDAIAKHN